MDNKMDERREFVRQQINLDVCVAPNGLEQKHIESRILNMSLLGCAIEPGSYPFKEQEKLSICFQAAKEDCSKSTAIDAKVCHVCDEYIGLCFKSMGEDVMELLRELLKEAKYF
jgi:hypothetical protein